MLIRAEAIVMRSMDYGEGNKIITLFTREYGKLGAVARGARKPKSRLAAASQPFTCGEYVIFKAGGSLGTLNDAEIEYGHQRIREDLHRAAFASYWMEFADRTIADGERLPWFYEQLKAALAALEQGKPPGVLTRAIELQLLSAAGYQPKLDACVECGGEQRPWAFGAREGGLLCARCAAFKSPPAGSAASPEAPLAMTDGAVKLLRVLAQLDLRRLGGVTVKPETDLALQAALRRYVDVQTELRLKSRQFLDQLDKYGI
ncbi:DNA repair protein RecO [Paenibacillus thermoaerophilus]|uniref:DNA repair protein RecO n=1 Tax=Paenibacillus thermoaerophilus TaxID=1215385 RepID=A0ABW2UXL4_9BACL|nr:DNA repair protein RecO [Paenibacillus thermoaerophilus]TMV19032.1 DNA repair protein RecO [Paenibacillus thermoaerophilus]